MRFLHTSCTSCISITCRSPDHRSDNKVCLFSLPFIVVSNLFISSIGQRVGGGIVRREKNYRSHKNCSQDEKRQSTFTDDTHAHTHKMQVAQSCLVSTILLVMASVPFTRAQCACDTASNRATLLAFCTRTGGGASWAVTTTLPICSWGGVIVCGDDNNGAAVTQINLNGRALVGNLSTSPPFSFLSFSSLTLLDVSQTSLVGTIESFALPTSLQVLRLASGFTGRCPEWGLPNLTVFSCQQCGLQGPLPSSWCNNGSASNLSSGAMWRLQVIEVTGNRALVGPLPPSWASCPLTLIDVSGIRDAGVVPMSWQDPSQPISQSIKYLRLGSSGLSGNVPVTWFTDHFPHLQELSIAENELNGSLPANASTSRLLSLDASGNQLSGEITRTFGTNLSTLRLARNHFVGALPPTLPRSLTVIDLSDNTGLTGPIPIGWSEGASAPALQQILLGGCNLSGSVPQGWLYSTVVQESLLHLNMSHNQLNGMLVPATNTSQRSTVKFLSLLDIAWNNIFGPFPIFINAFSYVDVSHNRLQGTLPQLLPVSYFDASYNSLTGTIPSAWGGALIDVLDLSFNFLSGSLAQLSNTFVKGASLVNVSHNVLSGAVPASITAAGSVVDLSWNRFTLPLPQGDATSMINELDLSHNALVGPVQNIFPLQASLISIDLSFNGIISISKNGTTFGSPTQLVSVAPNLQTLLLRNCSLEQVPHALPDSIWQLDFSFNDRLGGKGGNNNDSTTTSVQQQQQQEAAVLSGFWRWAFHLRLVDLSFNPSLAIPSVPIALCQRLRGVEFIRLSGILLPFPQIRLALVGTRVIFRGQGSQLVVSSESEGAAWIESWCETLTPSTAVSTTLVITPTTMLSPSRSAVTPTMSPTKKTRAPSISRSISATVTPTMTWSLNKGSFSSSHTDDFTMSDPSPSSSQQHTTTLTDSISTQLTMSVVLTVSPATATLPTPSASRHRVSITSSKQIRAPPPVDVSVPTILSIGASAIVALIGASQAGMVVAITQGTTGTSSLRDRCHQQQLLILSFNGTTFDTDADDEMFLANSPFTDLMDNPTTLAIPFGDRAAAGPNRIALQNAAGAVVGNFVVVLGFVTLRLVGTQVRQFIESQRCCCCCGTTATARRSKRQHPMHSSDDHNQHSEVLQAGTQIPGGLMGIFLILLFPSVAAVVFLFIESASSVPSASKIASLVSVGAAGCILFLGPIIAVAYHVLRNVDVLVECHSAEDDTMDSLQLQWSNSWSARARRLLRWLTYHRSHWSARAGASGRAASDFALRYGQVFGVYNGRHRRFFIVEFGVVLCSGVVLGAALSAADACAAVVWGGVLLAALSGGLGAAHAVLLPTTARIESVSIALVASLTCAAEWALAFSSSNVGQGISLAAAVLELVLVCVGFLIDVLPRFCNLFPQPLVQAHKVPKELARALRNVVHRGRAKTITSQQEALMSLVELAAFSSRNACRSARNGYDNSYLPAPAYSSDADSITPLPFSSQNVHLQLQLLLRHAIAQRAEKNGSRLTA